jgi:phosphoglycerate dehydrogenase-like enzyme
VGTCLADFQVWATTELSLQQQQPNIIFISHPNARETLIELLHLYPTIEWIHTRSAGVDHLLSITDGTLHYLPNHIQLTNAKGMYSSTLAEYTLMTCSYFAKDLPRLLHQKSQSQWIQYPVQELRGSTMGIVGFGDIGRACAKLAKAYGMTVLGLKRTKPVPSSLSVDPYCDKFYYESEGEWYEMLSRSDYILVSTPLTKQTRGLISKEALSRCQSTAVIINVGRGPIIDEEALIEALRSGAIKGAGLDVTTIEPLPKDSQLWNLDNVLLSPHNMDMTTTFMKESTDFFIQENLTRFVRGTMLLNPVDKFAGY